MRICSLHFEANCFKGKRLEWKIVAATLDEREREREREKDRKLTTILCFFVHNWINFSVCPCVVSTEVVFIGVWFNLGKLRNGENF